MEKFTVDLDKVLDEFEFNEDREEQLLLVGKKGFNNLTSKTNGKNILHNEATPGATQVFEQIQSAKTAAQPMNSVLRTSVFPSLIEKNSWDVKGRKTNSSNSKDHVEKITTSNKVNVSGVFSSLNDYLNAGNLNVSVKNVGGLPYEKNENIIINETKHDSNEIKTIANYPDANQQKLNTDPAKPSESNRCSESNNYFSVGNGNSVRKEVAENPDSAVIRKEITENRDAELLASSPHNPERFTDYKINAPPTETFSNVISEIQDSATSSCDIKTINESHNSGSVLDTQKTTTDVNRINGFEDAVLLTDTKTSGIIGHYGSINETPLIVDNHVNSVYISESNNFIPDVTVLSHSSDVVDTSASFPQSTVPVGDTNNGNQISANTSENSPSKVLKQPFSFSAVEELSDSELDQYLKELEEIYDNEVAGIESEDSSEQSSLTDDLKVSQTAEESNVSAHEHTTMPGTVSSTERESKDERICQNVTGGELIIEHTSSLNESVPESNSSDGNTSKDSLRTESEQNESEKIGCKFSLNSSTSCEQNTGTITRTKIAAATPPVSQQLTDLEECKPACISPPSNGSSTDDKKHCSSKSLPTDLDKDIDKITELVSSCYLSDRKGSAGHVNILGTSNVTASVNNVISIECQQTNCEKDAEKSSLSSTVENLSELLAHMKIGESIASDNGSAEIKSEKGVDAAVDKSSSEVGGISGATNFSTTVLNNGDITKSVSAPHHTNNPDEQKPSLAPGISDDGEKPVRPKYLHLPSKIVVSEEREDFHGLTKARHVGTPGEISSKCDGSEGSQVADAQGSVSSNSDSHTSPEASETSPVELPSSPLPEQQITMSGTASGLSPEERNLGKYPPFWIPDADAQNCMLCNMKFSVIKRRHHCRACGKVLCSKCCSLKASLDYMDNAEGRVCHPCFGILARAFISEHTENVGDSPAVTNNESSSGVTGPPLGRQPNPNNPMEYCSTIPPLEQAASAVPQPLPSVMVPVGVLKREGSSRSRSEVTKQVMFSDGIRPGGDLTELDGSSEPRMPFRRQERTSKRVGTPPGTPSNTSNRTLRALLPLDPNTKSYIPSYKGLPPLASVVKGDLRLDEETDVESLMKRLKDDNEPPITFALNRNLFVQLKIVNLKCCVNRTCWCFSTIGMSSVGQDEIVIILECLPDEAAMPRDIFTHLNTLYQEAARGRMVSELGHSVFQGTTFLGSAEHGGFIYIRPSFQCLNNLILPPAPYLVGILIHRWETPWAKVFPIRLMLRLGAEFRYYPCMLVSVRGRTPVYCEIGHTIINLLADFRNLSYTLPSVRGLVIHMEDRHTSVLLPKNRYDQVTRALNNSNDHVLAFAANFSYSADSHLVCIQSPGDESYHTQAINIHNKPRKVTGASFVVFNGALKASSNLTAKSSIVEDGLMVQITPETIQELRSALRNMKDFSISCGPTGVEQPDEMVYIKWVEDDKNFNIGVKSLIDGRPLDGIPSIRVHNGTDYMGGLRFIRWTEVFIIQSEETSEPGSDPIDISRLTESIAKATCLALINLLDLLAQAGLTKIAIRAMIHPENVGYEAGSQEEKLPPIYMNSLDNELIPILHKAASMSQDSPAVVLELIFHIMLQ